MNWHIYKAVYQAETPIHLGDTPFGFIQPTRYFIPGWTLWGAITAKLTRTFFSKADGKQYQSIGKSVCNSLKTSYGYLMSDDKICYPNYQNNRLQFGSYTRAEYESRFIQSLGKTAIAPQHMAAKTGALHELEYIATKDLESMKPVQWLIYYYIQENFGFSTISEEFHNLSSGIDKKLLKALRDIFVGGELGYGFGKIKMVSEPEHVKKADSDFLQPIDIVPKRGLLRAHLRVKRDQIPEGVGHIDVVQRRWWENDSEKLHGAGQKVEATYFAAPGSEIDLQGKYFTLGSYGVWELKEAL